MAHYGCCFYQSKIPLDILTKNMPIMCIMLFSGGVLFFSGTNAVVEVVGTERSFCFGRWLALCFHEGLRENNEQLCPDGYREACKKCDLPSAGRLKKKTTKGRCGEGDILL